MTIKEAVNQVRFVAANRSKIERLAAVQAQIISDDVTRFLKSIVWGIILTVVSLLLLLVMLLCLLFGLNEIVVTHQARLWLFFGGSIFLLTLALFIVVCIGLAIKSSIKILSEDLKELKEGLALLLGRLNIEEVEEQLTDIVGE